MSNETPGETIDMQEILRRIPHRYPLLLVDRCENYRPFECIVGLKGVTMNEPFFQGHFPGDPIMPGVLIVEAMAQTGAILMSKSLDVDVGRTTIFFAALENARFRKPVRPGGLLRMVVTVTKHRGLIIKYHGEAWVDDQLATEANWTAMAVDTPK